MFGPLDAPALGNAKHIADKLEPGELSKVKQTDIPSATWDRHRLKHSNPERHGLKLKSEPFAIAVFKYADGNAGIVIGYAE
jgi:hypothetical protein